MNRLPETITGPDMRALAPWSEVYRWQVRSRLALLIGFAAGCATSALLYAIARAL